MAVTADEFKKALQYWASGVTVVTANSPKLGLQGMTVSAFCSVSAEPPQILVCLNEAADTGEGILQSGCFAVNVLEKAQQGISNQFAGGCSHEDRFANSPWTAGETGAPLLAESLMSLDCTLVDRVKAGTHWIVIGEVQAVVCREGEPLLYYRGAYRQLSA